MDTHNGNGEREALTEDEFNSPDLLMSRSLTVSKNHAQNGLWLRGAPFSATFQLDLQMLLILIKKEHKLLKEALWNEKNDRDLTKFPRQKGAL